MEIRNGTKIDAGRDSSGEIRSTGRRDGPAAPGAKGSAAPSGDRVTLTDAAQRLLKSTEAETGAPVDSSRVAEIRAAIENGTYQIDSRKIADALLAIDNPR